MAELLIPMLLILLVVGMSATYVMGRANGRVQMRDAIKDKERSRLLDELRVEAAINPEMSGRYGETLVGLINHLEDRK